MARFPDKTAIGPGPSLRVERRMMPDIGLDTAAVAGDVAAKTIALAGGIWEKHENDKEAADAEYRFQAFQDDWRKNLLARQQSAEPGAPGFMEGVTGDYVKGASDFLPTLPRRLQGEFKTRLKAFESQVTTSADLFARKEAERFGLERVDDLRNRHLIGVSQPGGDPEAAIRDFNLMVDRSPGISPATKDKAKHDFAAQAREAHALGQIERDPAAAKAWTGAKVPGSYADKVAMPESGGDYAVKPNADSGARGRYQFIRSTWVPIAREADPQATAGKTDDEVWAMAQGKENAALQDKAFALLTQKNEEKIKAAGFQVDDTVRYLAHWFGADTAIKIMSDPRRPIEELLPSGKTPTGKTWAEANGLAGKTGGDAIRIAYKRMNEPGAAPSMAGTGGTTGTTATTPKGREFVVPEGITYAGFQRLKAAADAAERRNTADEAKAYAAYKDKWELAIATGSVADSNDILNDKTLKDGDKASLINSWNSKFKAERAADAVVAEFIARRDAKSGGYNPYDAEDRKKADVLWDRFGGPKSGDVLQADSASRSVLRDLLGTGAPIPKDVIARLRQGLGSKDPAEVEKAATLAAEIGVVSPQGLAAAPDAEDVRAAAAKYRGMVDKLGYSSADAARRIQADSTPERKLQREALKKLLDGKDGELAKLEIGDVRRALGQTGLLPAGSAMLSTMTGGLLGEHRATEGFSPADSASALSDYKRYFEDAFLKSGDRDLAKAEADQRIKGVYGVTSVGGTPRLMKYPPEKFYPPVDGSHDYLTAQAVADLKQATGKDIKPDGIILRADENTDREARAGIPPAYVMFYRVERDGQMVLERAPGDFRPDYLAARKASEDKRAADFARGHAEQRTLNKGLEDVMKGKRPDLDKLRERGFPYDVMIPPTPGGQQDQQMNERRRKPSASDRQGRINSGEILAP